jgi:leucyl aminopeptidase
MISLSTADVKKTKPDALLIFATERGDQSTQSEIIALEKKAKKQPSFKAEKGDSWACFEPAGLKSTYLLVKGLGKKEQTDQETLRSAVGKAIKFAIGKKLTSLSILLPENLKLSASEICFGLTEGAYLGNYQYNNYKEEVKNPALKTIEILIPKKGKKELDLAFEKARTLCKGTMDARDWINCPANDLYPETFSAILKEQAKEAGIKYSVLNKKDLEKKGFGSLLSVSQGSAKDPCMVIMEYSPVKSDQLIALIGKSVTFDSGGISLKPSGHIETMKEDMSGGAAVAATILTCARLGIQKNIVAAIPMVENMPSGTATRPGDVVKSLSGKTIEVLNTDAEGRLILIDAMTYIQNTYKPTIMVDMATLTGACVVALGESLAGVMGNAKKLTQAILKSSVSTHERCWELPLLEDYKKLLKSSIADIQNISSKRYGGSITAALFLNKFIDEGQDWAHIDIAGTAFSDKGSAYGVAGGTGFGVRLLTNLVENW